MSTHLTTGQYKRVILPLLAKRSKYGNKRCESEGIKFDSLKEMRFYHELKLREKAGEVSDIVAHPRWPIIINGIHVCFVELDFSYLDHRHQCQRFVDIKGFYTSESRLKHKLLAAQESIEIEVVK